jgi:predicted DNA-binding transcriptional regulator AlpA
MLTKTLDQPEADIFLTARDMRRRYGNVSDMWLYRREHGGDCGFPKPIRICGRRFWRLSQVVQWENQQISSQQLEA